MCVSSSVRRATFRHERCCCCGEVRKSWPSTSARMLITRWPQINVKSGKLYTIGILKFKKSLNKLSFSVMNWESTSQRLTDSSFVARRAVFLSVFKFISESLRVQRNVELNGASTWWKSRLIMQMASVYLDFVRRQKHKDWQSQKIWTFPL